MVSLQQGEERGEAPEQTQQWLTAIPRPEKQQNKLRRKGMS
jgi:hypothetical protein